MPVGNVNVEPGGSNVVKVPAGSNCADAKSTPTLRNIFLRIFVFIRCLWFVCPFTEVLQEIRRDITRKVWIFFWEDRRLRAFAKTATAWQARMSLIGICRGRR